MVNAQEYLNQKYPQNRQAVKTIDLSGWNESSWTAKPEWKKLTDELDLSEFTSLEKLDCSFNEITSLNLTNCSSLTELKCWDNQLTEIKFTTSLNLKIFYAWTNYLTEIDWNAFSPENLTSISISNNNLEERNIDVFSQFTNLEELLIGNDIEERLEKNICNRFVGSLKFLTNLTKLKKLQIEETNVEEDSEYLLKKPNLEVISWVKKMIIKKLYSDLDEKEKEKIRNANKKDFSQVLSEVVIDHDVKLKNLTPQQKEEIKKMIDSSININTRSKKELENGLKIFEHKLEKFIEEKQNELAISVVSPERLFINRSNIRQFVNKWGKKGNDDLMELDKLLSPEELNNYYRWRIYTIQFIGRGSAVAGAALTFQDQGTVGGGILAVYPFTELAVSKLEKNLEIGENKWKEFLADSDNFLDNYNGLLGILAQFEIKELQGGEVNEAIKDLDKKVKKFLKIYDANDNKEIDINELTSKRLKLIEDLEKGERSRIQEIMKAIESLEKAVIDHRKSSYYGVIEKELEEDSQSNSEDESVVSETELTKLKDEIDWQKEKVANLEIKLKEVEIDYYQIKKEITEKEKDLLLLRGQEQLNGEEIKSLEEDLRDFKQIKNEAKREINNLKVQLTRSKSVHLENQFKNLGIGNWWSSRISYGVEKTWNGTKYCAAKTYNFLTAPAWYWEQWKNRKEELPSLASFASFAYWEQWKINKEELPVWKNINSSFTSELIWEWKKQKFTCKECEDWIKTSPEQSQAIQEPAFYAWLRDRKEITLEQFLDDSTTINLIDLRRQYQEDKQKEDNGQPIEIYDKVSGNPENNQEEEIKEDHQAVDLDKHFEEKEQLETKIEIPLNNN